MTQDPLSGSHWFEVGARTAERLFNLKPANKPVAEVQASLKGLQGNPKMSFVSGFKLKTIELEKNGSN